MTAVQVEAPEVTALVGRLVEWLETGESPKEVFAPDVFVDFTPPQWRVQASNAEDAIAMRRGSHPLPGKVAIKRLDAIPTGFAMEIEERWHDGQQGWYCRELFRADVAGDRITQLSVYCTGDWDEACQAAHAAAVELIRP